MRLPDRTDLAHCSIQLAREGLWEEAFVVDAARLDALCDWLDAAGENVAIEAVYSDPAGRLAGFVGFRKRIADAAARRAFWTKAAGARTGTPGRQIATWLDLLSAADLTATPADHCELGVFNLWRSAGALALLDGRLPRVFPSGAPDWLSKGAPAPICLEKAWKTPTEFWIADVVSHEIGGRHRLAEGPAAN